MTIPAIDSEAETNFPQEMDLRDSEIMRLSDIVYMRLLRMILSGDLKPGQQVSELELTRHLKVSRTPVHEAMGQLIKDGLVIQRPNRRPVIADFSSDDVYDIYEMRCILESEAAAKAASRIDRVTIARLHQMADELKSILDLPHAFDQWVRFDDEFHAAIAKASGSRRLEEDITRYRRLNGVINKLHRDVSVLEPALEEHLDILKSLEDRDVEGSRQKMRRHLEEWQRFFVQHLVKK
jgi:Transcriptional regulators